MLIIPYRSWLFINLYEIVIELNSLFIWNWNIKIKIYLIIINNYILYNNY